MTTATIEAPVKSLHDSKDLGLAYANAAKLAAIAGVSAVAAYAPSGMAIMRIAALVGHIIADYLQLIHVGENMPESTPLVNKLVKVLTSPPVQRFGPLLLCISGLSSVAKAYSAAICAGIALNSAPKLYASLKNITQSPRQALSDAAVHAFNLASQFYFTNLSWRAYDIMDDEFYPSLVTCSVKDPSDFEHMSPIKRLTTPELTPECPSHAEIMMGIKDPTCNAVRSAFRKLALVVHPDKNPGNSQATIASANLNNAYNSLKSAYSC